MNNNSSNMFESKKIVSINNPMSKKPKEENKKEKSNIKNLIEFYENLKNNKITVKD